MGLGGEAARRTAAPPAGIGSIRATHRRARRTPPGFRSDAAPFRHAPGRRVYGSSQTFMNVPASYWVAAAWKFFSRLSLKYQALIQPTTSEPVCSSVSR